MARGLRACPLDSEIPLISTTIKVTDIASLSWVSAARSIARKLLSGCMSDIYSVDNVDDVLGDVGRMVADTLDSLRHRQVVQSNRDCPRVFHHVLYELAHEGSKLVIDGFVILDNLCCCNGIHS